MKRPTHPLPRHSGSCELTSSTSSLIFSVHRIGIIPELLSVAGGAVLFAVLVAVDSINIV